MKQLIFLFFYAFSIYFLITINVNMGLTIYENERWHYLYLLCFIGLIIIPFLSIVFVFISCRMGLDYKNSLQKK